MDESERSAFEGNEHFEALVALRRADDDAKVTGREVPGLGSWRVLLDQLAAASS
jgi:hypothetical protein